MPVFRKITADWLYPAHAEPMREGVLVVDTDGKIHDVVANRSSFDPAELETYAGALVPGFVNTHCHLELSHMKGKVDTGTGLIDFIRNVVTRRAAPPEEIAAAIAAAEQEMLDGGIVAVGDISNVVDTFAQKALGRLRYYTFVECFDFLQSQNAAEEFAKYTPVYEALTSATNGTASRKSLVPHAPYSVSPSLFERINHANAATHDGKPYTVSIHNQETPPENELFERGRSAFTDFYAAFGVSLEGFAFPHKTAIHYALEHLDPAARTLFVHNTLTTRDDVRAAQGRIAQTFWATCPNANLYIENRLPDYRVFLDTNAAVTLGTDSLTSNWQLSILAEMQAIARHQSYVPFAELVRWATYNGACALGFENELGSFEVGKRPGVNLIEGFKNERLTAASTVRRLV